MSFEFQYFFQISSKFKKKTVNTFRACYEQSFWMSTNVKFIVLPTGDSDDFVPIFQLFITLKRLNVVVFKQGENSTQLMALKYFKPNYLLLEASNNTDEVFFDKLQDMEGYNYKAAAVNQIPRLIWRKGKFYGFDVFFMEIVAKYQNAKFSIEFVNASDPNAKAQMAVLILMRNLDIGLNTINSGIGFDNFKKFFKTFNTYDVDGFCALVPIPQRNSFFGYFFVPYDRISWMFMLISVISLGIVWKIFKAQHMSRSLNSSGHMVFGAIGGFLGQAFKYRHTRWFHLMIIQIFIFMMLVLGSAYQSLLVSLLTVARNGTRISTVDELIKGDFNFFTDPTYYDIVNKLDLNNPIRSKLHKDSSSNFKIDIAAKHANNSVLITRCSYIHDMVYTANTKYEGQQPLDLFYILPEKLFAFYETLMTGRYSPFADRFEEISLRIFESGIKQHWTTLLRKFTDQIDLKEIAIIKEEHLLKLDDLKYVFYLCGFGLFGALIVFFAELIHHKYRRTIENAWKMRMLKGLKERREGLRGARRTQIEPFEL